MAQYGMPSLSPGGRHGGRKANAPTRSPASPKNKSYRSASVAEISQEAAKYVELPSRVARDQAKDDAAGVLESSRFSTAAPSIDAHGVVLIDDSGDIVLRLEHRTAVATLSQKYRVSSEILKSVSKYFARLLEGRFGESARIEQQHSVLRAQYCKLGDAPSLELPQVSIEDVGRISAVKSIDGLCSDFLLILHSKDTATAVPVANLANIAIVADRFDALDKVRSYASRKKLMRAIDGKTTAKIELSLSEERVRQRILVGLLLDYGPWLDKYSARLVTAGSTVWTGREAGETDAMWWHLPQQLEEELLARREYILDMLQSSVVQFVGLYTSRERQCRLGYDSSAACDSFQLGEMVRFLARAGMLQLKGTLFDSAEPPEPYVGDVFSLIESLRQIPEYQIDRNHSHCGIRGRLIQMLDIVVDALHHVGICAECWSTTRHEQAWVDLQRPLLWRSQAYRSRGMAHTDLHTQMHALFTAKDRDWK